MINYEFFSINNDSVSTGADNIDVNGAEIAMPTSSRGVPPQRVLITCSAAVHYFPVIEGQTKTAAEMPILGAGMSVAIDALTGFVYFRSLTGTAKVRITPLES